MRVQREDVALALLVIAGLLAIGVTIFKGDEKMVEVEKAYHEGYENAMEDYYLEYVEWVEEYYELYTEYKVLEERAKWLESKGVDRDLLFDTIESIIDYYETYDGELTLEEWLVIYRSDVYERLREVE